MPWTVTLIKSALEWLLTMNMKKVFESPSQNSKLNPFENLQNNLKTDRHRCSLSNLSKLEHICILRWEKIAKFLCA